MICIDCKSATQEQRAAVQEKLFETGYKWPSTDGTAFLSSPYYYYDKDIGIQHTERHPNVWTLGHNIDVQKMYNSQPPISWQEFLGELPDEDPVEMPYAI